MNNFQHNPHPVDLSDFFLGRNIILGGRDFDKEDRAYEKSLPTEKAVNSGKIISSVNKIRRSVSDKLFAIDLTKITF